ncbi:hypothetical protein EON79_00340 [bacterium]|nr:MAG: hypothetical protein EON79_00340 [bacterium]
MEDNLRDSGDETRIRKIVGESKWGPFTPTAWFTLLGVIIAAVGIVPPAIDRLQTDATVYYSSVSNTFPPKAQVQWEQASKAVVTAKRFVANSNATSVKQKFSWLDELSNCLPEENLSPPKEILGMGRIFVRVKNERPHELVGLRLYVEGAGEVFDSRVSGAALTREEGQVISSNIKHSQDVRGQMIVEIDALPARSEVAVELFCRPSLVRISAGSKKGLNVSIPSVEPSDFNLRASLFTLLGGICAALATRILSEPFIVRKVHRQLGIETPPDKKIR